MPPVAYIPSISSTLGNTGVYRHTTKPDVCVQWEYREWKYQKMSEVGGLAYRFSGVELRQL